MKRSRLVLSLMAASWLAPLTAAAEAVQVDAGIPAYKTVSGVAGNLNSIGSDTLNNLMTLWAEAFRAKYPNVRIQIEGKGSSTAPPALRSSVFFLGRRRPPRSTPSKRSSATRRRPTRSRWTRSRST